MTGVAQTTTPLKGPAKRGAFAAGPLFLLVTAVFVVAGSATLDLALVAVLVAQPYNSGPGVTVGKGRLGSGHAVPNVAGCVAAVLPAGVPVTGH